MPSTSRYGFRTSVRRCTTPREPEVADVCARAHVCPWLSAVAQGRAIAAIAPLTEVTSGMTDGGLGGCLSSGDECDGHGRVSPSRELDAHISHSCRCAGRGRANNPKIHGCKTMIYYCLHSYAAAATATGAGFSSAFASSFLISGSVPPVLFWRSSRAVSASMPYLRAMDARMLSLALIHSSE